MKSQEETIESSNSDSSVCWTLPRNFRLRTVDSDGDEEDQENTPMLQPRDAQDEATPREKYDKKRLFRQHTISNPGYQMLMKRMKTSKKTSSKNVIPELPPRPPNSLLVSQSPGSNNPLLPGKSETYIGTNSLSSGYSTLNESQPNSKHLQGYSTMSDTSSNLCACRILSIGTPTLLQCLSPSLYKFNGK